MVMMMRDLETCVAVDDNKDCHKIACVAGGFGGSRRTGENEQQSHERRTMSGKAKTP